MPDWVKVGDDILNVDNIEHVNKVSHSTIIIRMSSGKVIEVTGTVALTLWKYLDSERLKFLDLENPTQDFSGT
jgi:hypothetical protein